MSKSDQNKTKRKNRDNRTSGEVSASEFFALLLSCLAALPHRLWKRIHGAGERTRALLREHKAGGFPESDHRLVQFFLLVPGMFPMWKALLRERLSRRRWMSLQLGTSGAPRGARQRRGRLPQLAFVAAALVLAAVGTFYSVYTPATTVSYNGRALETVTAHDAVEAQQIAARVEGLTAETLGKSFSLAANSIQYSNSLVRRSELGEVGNLEKELTDEIGLVTYAYSLYIDGELVGSTQYKGALEALIDQIKQVGVSADTLSVDFVEDVQFREGYVPTDSLVNLGRIAEILNSTKSGEVTYTVVQGDTWGKIAMEHEMSNAELEALNPGYDIDRINIGDELLISREVPYLTVRVTERQNYVDEVDFEIIYIDDDSMYQGDTRVIEKGEYGTADIVADVIYINGVETERNVISQVMLTAPKTETRLRGTKERPSWFPTGSFRWPASGRITSGFGYRNTGIRGASTNHMGIDIACAYGSPIYAADGGTVTYTGYKGAMGYTVIIDHGNGFVTYYEHCSNFTCSAGQHVYKGQQIARVGTSGVASGAHCHFGIQRNGSYVNPMNYLP